VTGLPTRLQRYLPFLALVPCLVLVAVAIPMQSRVIDGARVFWLDDDQMISMRYARNLVEGFGLVFNPGERVEGYTNPLWTLMMAMVHLLPVSEAKISLAVKALELSIVAGLFVTCARLLEELGAKGIVPRALLFFVMAQSIDVVFWAFNGFETPLVALLFTWSALRIVRGRTTLATALAVAAIPLARSDGFHLAAALIGLAILRRERGLATLVAVAIAIPALHVAWRRWYYGDWLPNTFYLKVMGLPGRLERGAKYTAEFLRRYSVPLLLAVVGARARSELRWIIAVVVLCVAFVLAVGGDAFAFSRFFAPVLPVVLVAAVAVVTSIEDDRSRRAAGIVLAGTMAFQGGVHAPRVFLSNNGNLPDSVLAGIELRKHSAEDATVAVITAGAIPYFSHRRAIDLLGKADREIARLAPRGKNPIGHLKYDYDAALARRPEFVVSVVPFPQLPREVCEWNEGYELALPCSPVFVRDYASTPITIDGLSLSRVFARRDLRHAWK
jgi:hypothetical protein